MTGFTEFLDNIVFFLQKFIACQAPKKSADGFPHFWHLIVQEKVQKIDSEIIVQKIK